MPSMPSVAKFASRRVVAMLSSISGWRAENRPRRGTSQDAAKAGGELTVSIPARGIACTRRVGTADLAEGVADRDEIGLPGLGERERAVGPSEQGGAESRLQAAHELADRAWCDCEFGGGLLHAEVAGGGLEGAEGVQRRQAGHGSE